MSIDRHYLGQINADGTRTLFRITPAEHDQLLPAYAWAGDGTVGWGSVHDPTQRPGELDAALAILVDRYNDPRLAFDNAGRLADDVLAAARPDTDLIVQDIDLRALVSNGQRFRADVAPVRDLLVATIADTGDPLDTVATGLGLDPVWVTRLAAGEITHLDLAEVKQVCAHLYITPYDLWSPTEARAIEDRWPASDWPVAQPIDPDRPISWVPTDTAWNLEVEPAATAVVELPAR